MKSRQLKKQKTKCALFLYAVTLILFSSRCKKDPTPEVPGNEEELITTFKLQLTDSATGQSTSYFFKDPDGDGGAAPFYGPAAGGQTDSVIQLLANKVYLAEVVLLDESKTPVNSISDEVLRESKDHLLFYNPQTSTVLVNHPAYRIEMPGSKLQIGYEDRDNGNPVRALGLRTKWRTSLTGKFPLTIILRHQPDIKDGSYAPGDSDLSVNFTYRIQ
jgi:hypothetical protein